jgi:hypothetical protein
MLFWAAVQKSKRPQYRGAVSESPTNRELIRVFRCACPFRSSK